MKCHESFSKTTFGEDIQSLDCNVVGRGDDFSAKIPACRQSFHDIHSCGTAKMSQNGENELGMIVADEGHVKAIFGILGVEGDG